MPYWLFASVTFTAMPSLLLNPPNAQLWPRFAWGVKWEGVQFGGLGIAFSPRLTSTRTSSA